MHTHLAGNMAQHHVAVFELDATCRVREILKNLPLKLDDVLLQCDAFFLTRAALPDRDLAYRIGSPAPLKFAFLSNESYWCDII